MFIGRDEINEKGSLAVETEDVWSPVTNEISQT